MTSYFKDAISKIYGEDDDFIIIGFTWRTGSGCSTVAKILSKSKEDIKHSLFSGNCPENNPQRKQKIILKNFESKWESFITIQASTVLTLILSELSIKVSSRFLGGVAGISDRVKKSIVEILVGIKKEAVNEKDIRSL